MRSNASIVACLLFGGSLSIGTPCAGQIPVAPGGSIFVAGEFGPRAYDQKLDPLAIGKFQEYRDMRASTQASALFQQLLVGYSPADSFGFYSLSARKLFDRDQSVWLLAKRPGQYDFQIRWDRIPQTYSTTMRSPGDELSHPGYNTLPFIRPDSGAWRNAPYIGTVRTQWDPIDASLAMTPTRNLDFKADFKTIGKKGGLPRSISFSGSSGPQREYVSPIDQRVNDASISQGYASGDRSHSDVLSFVKSYQVNVSYGYSRFQNSIKSTMVDNPQIGVSSFTNGAASSRVSLEPSNSAQTATANGAMLFPMRTRVTGSVTASWARQNDPFLPQTSNDSLARDPNYGLVSSYSRPSLDGQTRRTSFALSASTHPVDKLTAVAKFRKFDLSQQTAPFGIKAMIVSDRTVTLADSEKFEALPFTKANSDLGASYEVASGLALSAGYGWEQWTRDPDVRNIARTMEKTPKVSLDYTALDWFTLRTSYLRGSRRGQTPYTISGTEIDGFRRFDEADRDRSRSTFIASVAPISSVTLGVTVQVGNDQFPNSQYGVQSDKSLSRGLDLDVSPAAWFSLSGGWMQEDVRDSANYRYRTGTVGSATYDNVSYRWMNTNKDKNISYYATINATLIPDKLDLAASWSVTDSHWWMYNFNPIAPTGGTAAQNLSATAQDWPEVSQRMEPLSLGLRYHYSDDWAMSLRYQVERYSQNDFRTLAPVFTTTGLNGAPLLTVGYSPGDLPGTIGQVAGSNTGQYHFLGNNFHPYNAGWFTMLVTYHPARIPFARGRTAF